MSALAASPLDDGGPAQRNRSLRGRQCPVYASRVRPGLAPLTLGALPDAARPSVSPRWDSLSGGSHARRSPGSPFDSLRAAGPDPPSHHAVAAPMPPVLGPVPDKTPVYSRGSSPRRPRPDVRSPECAPVENFSRPRKQSIRQPQSEQCAPVPRLAHTDLLADMASPPPHTPPWQRPRRPSAASCQSTSTFSPLGPPPSVDLPDPRGARPRNAAGRPPFAPSTRAHDAASAASSPMMPGGHPPPWLAGDELRSSFRSQLSASTAFGTAVTERSSVLTKDSSITSYAATDEPSLEDVMCMYEKGFADDDDGQDDYEDQPTVDHVRRDAGRHGLADFDDRRSVIFAAHAPVNEVDAEIGADAQADARADVDSRRRSTSASPPPEAPRANSPPPIPTSRSILDAEIRQSKMIFSSPAFTASVPALSAKADADESEKRDSGKSLDSDHWPSNPAGTFKKAVAVPAGLAPSASAALRAATEPEDPGSRDRYGFKKQNQSISREQYDGWNRGYTQYLARRRKKWVAYLKECALMTDRPNRFPPPNAKTKRFVRKGIPPDWRGAAWFYYAGGPAILAKHSGLYEKLLGREVKQVDVEAIERDLHRTFPDNVRFQPCGGAEDRAPGTPPPADEPPIVSSLRRVLHAFAVYNPRIGYCQSLNFLAGLLLLFVETEEQCFWLLNVITIIYLPGTHEMSLEGSKVDLGVLMTELRDTMPAVWDMIGGDLEAAPSAAGKAARKPRPMLRRRDLPSLSTERLPPITLCMTAWFMSCYIGTLPIETTLRVWDVFFYEGSKTLFRIALAIFKSGEAEIKAVSDPMEMFGVVQSLPRRMLDANALMELCFKRRNGFGHISQDAIDELRQERREQAHQDRHLGVKTGAGESEAEPVRRRGTLFGRKRRDVSRPRAADV